MSKPWRNVLIVLFCLVLFFGIFGYFSGYLHTGGFIIEGPLGKPVKLDTYSTALLSYSASICDGNHNNGMTEDEIFSLYDLYILSEDSFYCIQNDNNKEKVFLYLDVWGKSSNVSMPHNIIPVPLNFTTVNFPTGHGNIPTYVKSDGSPFCYVQTDEYFDDLYNFLDEWLYNITTYDDIQIAGFFLDDWYDASDTWDGYGMSQESMDAAWPGRSTYPIPDVYNSSHPNYGGTPWTSEYSWWINDQLPRLNDFEDRLHNLLLSYFNESEIVVNGNYRQYRRVYDSLGNQIGWEPYYYGNETLTPNKTTHRLFEGPTVNTNNYIDFEQITLDYGESGYNYLREFHSKDILLMYSINGTNSSGTGNGAYGDWINTTYYQGVVDWQYAVDLANSFGNTSYIDLAYGNTPLT